MIIALTGFVNKMCLKYTCMHSFRDTQILFAALRVFFNRALSKICPRSDIVAARRFVRAQRPHFQRFAGHGKPDPRAVQP